MGKISVFCLMVFLLVFGAQAQWQFMATNAEITAVTGETSYYSGPIGTNGAGLFAVVCNKTASKILLINPATPTNKVQLLATQQNLVDAVNAANGDHADVTKVTIVGIDFNGDGKIIACSDGSSPEEAALFALEPTVPTTIYVLSCAVGSTGTSPLEGSMGVEVGGGYSACVLVNDFYGAAEDAVLQVDVSTLVNDGSAPVSSFIGETALQTASGDADPAFCDLAFSPDGIILGNSGASGNNDNLVCYYDNMVAPPSLYLYLAATDIESDIANTDIGYNALAVDSVGNVFLANSFGSGTADDGIIMIQNISSPNGDATIFNTETEIATDLGNPSGSVYFGNDGIVYDAFGNRLVLTTSGSGLEGVIYKALTSSVSDWALY
ncbi:hypothetical protein JW926_13160 [Candidatus Sumerlaeota bacterium]|nr:hypothetical protein [Candidatus Sumerlaeota bacterium]